LRELNRREVEATIRDRSRWRDRRGRGSTNNQVFRKPDTVQIPGNSPLLASIAPKDFSRLLAEVHREFEEELT